MTITCIAGMHRSATSMIARMLHLCGLYLGEEKDLVRSAADNPEGFWENVRFVEINEKILSKLNGSWDIPPVVKPGWESAPLLDPCRREAERLIRGMGDHAPWGWKDPRNSLTLPFWQKIIPDLKVVVCLRNPLEVAHSMARRGYSSTLFSARLWHTYNERLLAAVPKKNRILTHYNAFFYDPASELRRLLSFLELPQDKEKIDPALGVVNAALRHNRSASADLPDLNAYPEVIGMYSRLCAEAGPVFQASPSEPGGEKTPGQSDSSTPFLQSQPENEKQIAQPLRDKIDDLERAVQKLTEQVDKRDQRIQTLTNLVDEKALAVRALITQIGEKERTVQALTAQRDEQERNVQALTEHMDKKENAVQALTEQVERQAQAVQALTAQVGEKERSVRILTEKVEEKGRAIRTFTAQLKDKEQAVFSLTQELSEIKGGIAWFIFQLFRKVRGGSIPQGSRRDRFWQRIRRTIYFWRSEGTRATLHRIYYKLKTRQPERARPVSEAGLAASIDAFQRVYLDTIKTAQSNNEGLYVPIAEKDFDPQNAAIKAIAFYLPQFHPIPENDVWWGKGFTEWTNVSKAAPNFVGHYQPHLPGELGFYDLRVPEVQKRQVELARKYGIHGFCFHYYWFSGTRLLERPLCQFLENPGIDFPFCVCWANENWTRRWDGAEQDILIGQTHSEHETADFIRDLIPIFLDDRYIRVDGKPLLIVYRVNLMPNPRQAAEIWRSECRKNGIPDVYLVAAQSFGITDPRPYGFDAAVEFPPHNLGITNLDRNLVQIINPDFTGTVFDYEKAVQYMMNQRVPEYTLFRTVMPGWDNTARRQNAGHAFIHSTPEVYKKWLTRAIGHTRRFLPPDRQFIFINSWNEWGEGAYLEPDRLYGYAYLQATAEALAAEGTEKEEPVRELSAQAPGKEQAGRALTAQETEKEQAAQALAAEWTEKEEAVRELSAQAAGKEQDVQALTAQETEKEQAAQAREAQATVNDQAVQAPNGQLQEIANTRGSWLRQKIMAVRFKLIPAHTGREGLMRFLRGAHWLSPKILFRELIKETRQWLGGHPWAHNFIKSIVPNRIRKWLKHKVETRNPLAANTNLAHEITQEIAKSELSDWEEYLIMYGKIQAIRDSRLAGFQTRPVKITSVHQKDISPVARSLNFPQSNHPEISIVIPVHNNLELTLECLLSIKQHTHACRYEIVVVDDGSDQGTKDVLAAISHITFVRNDERIGFTFSCNKGAKKAKGRYLLFMNNDVQVTENWLQPLADVFRDQKSVGAVGPKVLNLDGRLQEAGAFINPDGTATLIGYHDNPDLPRYNHIREVDYCSGVCLLVKTDTFNEVGGFDPVYAPAYYEDVDLCLKLRSLGLRILYNPHSVIVHHLSATMKKIDSEFKTQLVTRNRQIFLERWQSQIDELNKTKLIAFYLPQFHPIPENDLWWGKGFTEWTNVVRAQPNFVGHYQPHLPSDLGFYDLRNADIMDQQIELAKRYGIFGFCYYYYWFDGKRLLEMPIERMIKTGKPDFPFCICWANENWTRRWDGDESHVLIGQKHSEEDDRAVIRDMIRYLQHPNYIRVEGKPLLVVYRVSLFPDFKKTAGTWRKICREEGVGEIQIVMAESFEFSLRAINPQDYGADALVEFPPHNMFSPKPAPGEMINRRFSGQIMDYNVELLKYVQKDISPCVEYKTVMPGWDNTARKQDTSYIFEGSSPGAYQAWLEEVIRITREQNSNQQRIVFINAWNEWGEGNHLEPDQRYGHRYLEATLNALNGNLLENRQR